jgi:predicted kinase
MPKLIVTCGVSGSGKSTYARELQALDETWGEINRDFWRFTLFCRGHFDWNLYKFTKDKEKRVTEECEKEFVEFVKEGLNIIVSNTNLNQRDHDYWQANAASVGYEFEVKYFPITFEEMLKRNEKRGTLAVKREVLIQQWDKWLDITNYKRYVPNSDKPKAIWVDIDGTVAVNTSRGHHDYDQVGTDSPRMDIISMITAWAENDNLQIIFMSGRPESCREETTNWLEKYFWDVDYLYMRTTGDNRSDRIVKEELFWQYLEPHWNIVASIDDRPRVVRLQHDLGIPNVINVQRGYDEF